MAFVESLPSLLFVVLVLFSAIVGYWAVNAGVTHTVSHWDPVVAIAAAAAWALFHDTQAPLFGLLLLGAAFNMGCSLCSLSKKSSS